jgi:hypothetical protein
VRPAAEQVGDFGDGQGDRVIIHAVQQFGACGVLVAGRRGRGPARSVRAVAPPVGHAVRIVFARRCPAVSHCGRDAGRYAGEDQAVHEPAGIAGGRGAACLGVRPGAQFGPLPVIDAERRLDRQARQVMHDMDRGPAGDAAGGQVRTIPDRPAQTP